MTGVLTAMIAAAQMEPVVASMNAVAAAAFVVGFAYAQRNPPCGTGGDAVLMVFASATLTGVFWTSTVALEWLDVMPVLMDSAHTVLNVATVVQFVIAAFILIDARTDDVVL